MFSSVRGTRASPGTPPPEGPPQAARAKAPKPSAWKRPRERPNRLGRNETRAWIQVVRGTMTYRATPPARKKRTRRRSAHGSGAPVSDRHRGRRPRNRTPPVTHTTPRPPPLRRRPTPNPVRQRNAGLRPASRPQAAKPHAASHPHHTPPTTITTPPHAKSRAAAERRSPTGIAAAGRETPAPSRKPETKTTKRRTRAQLSPRRSLWRGRHAAKGRPGVSPAARAMPVRDRRSTAVRASGGLSERGFVALSARPPGSLRDRRLDADLLWLHIHHQFLASPPSLISGGAMVSPTLTQRASRTWSRGCETR